MPIQNERNLKIVGWVATSLCVSMYFSYIDQIRMNLAGNPGSLLLPLVTVLNSCAWVVYGSLKEKKDWPIIISNTPGIFLGALTVVTGLL